METRYYIIATLVTLLFLLMILTISGCAKHKYASQDGVQVELPRTPVDREGGAR